MPRWTVICSHRSESGKELKITWAISQEWFTELRLRTELPPLSHSAPRRSGWQSKLRLALRCCNLKRWQEFQFHHVFVAHGEKKCCTRDVQLWKVWSSHRHPTRQCCCCRHRVAAAFSYKKMHSVTFKISFYWSFRFIHLESMKMYMILICMEYKILLQCILLGKRCKPKNISSFLTQNHHFGPLFSVPG